MENEEKSVQKKPAANADKAIKKKPAVQTVQKKPSTCKNIIQKKPAACEKPDAFDAWATMSRETASKLAYDMLLDPKIDPEVAPKHLRVEFEDARKARMVSSGT